MRATGSSNTVSHRSDASSADGDASPERGPAVGAAVATEAVCFTSSQGKEASGALENKDTPSLSTNNGHHPLAALTVAEQQGRPAKGRVVALISRATTAFVVRMAETDLGNPNPSWYTCYPFERHFPPM